ncbi:M23 family metallopeptidase [Microbacterium sp. P06]|uniref:M23 family metallopeptidase n=1 Tax=Microbacterium sp. P06 TaxID=3366949 RepID=UPI0037471E12
MTLERLDDADDCGCAPTARERGVLWPSVDRRTMLTFGGLGIVALGAIGGAVGGPLVPGAFAATYPSWPDVERAKASEASKAAEVTRIQGLISNLSSEVTRTQAEAQAASDIYYAAQQDFLNAAYQADQLQAQADAKGAEATDAANQAGQVAAQLYRKGGDDASLELFFAGSAASADDLLSRLGTMDKLLDRNQSVYAAAVAARNSAQSLTNQAVDKRAERDRLQQVAEEKMVAAQQASDAAQAALAAQQANQITLQAQLAALQDSTAKTIADYEAGVEAERQARLAREAAERAAAEQRARDEAAAREREAANNNNGGGGGGGGNSGGGGGGGNSGGGGGGGGGGGVSVGSGWSRPSSAWVSSWYGPRAPQCTPTYCATSNHLGLDFGAGCGAPTYAANSGVVTYAGYNGGYGNYVRIDHGNGFATGYAHSSRLLVSRGQQVSSGQTVGLVGLTGNVFGCHLHFEVYQGGRTIDPAPFLRARGISV